jgi:hypothetical protein
MGVEKESRLSIPTDFSQWITKNKKTTGFSQNQLPLAEANGNRITNFLNQLKTMLA